MKTVPKKLRELNFGGMDGPKGLERFRRTFSVPQFQQLSFDLTSEVKESREDLRAEVASIRAELETVRRELKALQDLLQKKS